MSTADSRVESSGTTVHTPPGEHRCSVETPLKAGPWSLAAAGIVTASAVWFIAERHYPFFAYLHVGMARAPDPGELETISRYNHLNPAVLLAIFAAAHAAMLAIVEGVARRSTKYVLVGVVSGVLIGGGLGAAAGWLAQSVFDLPMHQLIDMAKTVVVQATCWSLTGLGIGIGFTLPAWRRKAICSGAVGAVVGGLLAALIFGPAAALTFQLANTDTLVPQQSVQRLMWLLTAAVLMGFAAGGLGRPRKTKSQNPEQ